MIYKSIIAKYSPTSLLVLGGPVGNAHPFT